MNSPSVILNKENILSFFPVTPDTDQEVAFLFPEFHGILHKVLKDFADAGPVAKDLWKIRLDLNGSATFRQNTVEIVFNLVQQFIEREPGKGISDTSDARQLKEVFQ